MKSLPSKLLIVISLLILTGCCNRNAPGGSTPQIARENAESPDFEYLSGPNTNSKSSITLFIIQHKETGKRYILADRDNGGVFIQPID